MKKCGIYKIKCIKNNKFYIGSSSNIEKRIKNHFSSLERGDHGNILIQRIYDKYSKESLIWEVLEFCSISNLEQRETYYIQTSDKKYLLNLNTVCSTRRGHKASKKLKEKLSLSHMGIKHSEETKLKIKNNLNLKSRTREKNSNFNKGISIHQIDKKNNNIIETFINMKRASEKTGTNHGHIADVVNGKRKSAGGFLWRIAK